jgi:hypothetical protein
MTSLGDPVPMLASGRPVPQFLRPGRVPLRILCGCCRKIVVKL